MSKHVQIEANMSLAGANADKRIPVTIADQKKALVKLYDAVMGASSGAKMTKADAEVAIANAISETLIFSGIEAGSLDVMFLNSENPICAKLAKFGLRFDLPKLIKKGQPAAPGSDPKNPPILI